MSRLPEARRAGLITEELQDELLIYDTKRNKAHCLNRASALVWKHCDGRTTIEELAKALEEESVAPADESIVWLALEQLERRHLLRGEAARPAAVAKMSRREMVRALGLATASIPLITSVVAPTAVKAASCLAAGSGCRSNAQCCSTNCFLGVCSVNPP